MASEKTLAACVSLGAWEPPPLPDPPDGTSDSLQNQHDSPKLSFSMLFKDVLA